MLGNDAPRYWRSWNNVKRILESALHIMLGMDYTKLSVVMVHFSSTW
jgi:hypothetical protein